MIKSIVLILALFLSMGLTSQEIVFTKRPLYLVEYSTSMALPIIAFELFADGEKDKKRHFEAGYLTTASVGYFLRKKDYPLYIQVLVSLLSGYAVTYGKELYDAKFGTGFNQLDINAGCWGANASIFTFIISTRHKAKTIKR